MSDKYAVKNKLPSKQVSILAHRKKRLVEEESHNKVKRLNRKFKLPKKKLNFIRAESLIMEYRKAERDAHRMKRLIHSGKLFEKPDDESTQDQTVTKKLLVVVRHRAPHIASSITRKILASLNLYKINHVTFLKNNEESNGLLKLIEPYVTWGYPTINTVRDIVFKHGFMKVDGKRSVINSNKIIEDVLGEHGIICIEDIVHELFTVSNNFDLIKEHMTAFLIKPPRDGWKNKPAVAFWKGGECGDRKEKINDFIQRCI